MEGRGLSILLCDGRAVVCVCGVAIDGDTQQCMAINLTAKADGRLATASELGQDVKLGEPDLSLSRLGKAYMKKGRCE